IQRAGRQLLARVDAVRDVQVPGPGQVAHEGRGPAGHVWGEDRRRLAEPAPPPRAAVPGDVAVRSARGPRPAEKQLDVMEFVSRELAEIGGAGDNGPARGGPRPTPHPPRGGPRGPAPRGKEDPPRPRPPPRRPPPRRPRPRWRR